MAGVSGVTGAAPIWRDVMETATAGAQVVVPGPPEGLVRARVCTPTGLAPGPDCPSPDSEWFVRGTEPQGTEHYYVRGPGGELLVNPPAEARAWALDAGLQLAPATLVSRAAAVVIHQPAEGATVYMAPETGTSDMVIRASSTTGAATIELLIDGEPAGSVASGAAFVWAMTPGTHVLEAVARTSAGEIGRATASFEVKAR
jgi:penicillin-binding protein 1C